MVAAFFLLTQTFTKSFPLLRKSVIPALVWLVSFNLSHDVLIAWIVSAALFVCATAHFIPAQGKRQYAWAGAINLLVYGLVAAWLRSPSLTTLSLAFVILGTLLSVHSANAFLRFYRLCRPLMATPGAAVDGQPFHRRWNSFRDWPGIFAVQWKIFPDAGATLAVLVALLSGSLLSITENGQSVAIAAVQPNALRDGRLRAVHWLALLAVLPEHRGKGYARALLARVGPSVLAVRPENRAAIGLYETSGYAIVEHWWNYYGPHADALIMLRR